MSASATLTLAELSRIIRNPDRELSTLVHETEQLRQLVEAYSDIQVTAGCDLNAGKTLTPHGLAVSALQAAFCAREPLRTAAFVKGLDLAVRTVIQKQPLVRVLYAGCGPYALLALPLMAAYSPQQLQFSLLEIHPQTLSHALNLIKTLGLQDYVLSFHQTDASQYRIPATEMPDIILSETMNNALGKEPQVAIMRNLYSQAPHALLVPEAVHVHLACRNQHVHHDPLSGYEDLGPVFTLDAAHLQSWHCAGHQTLPADSIRFSRRPGQELYWLTRIHTFGQWQLQDHQSSLNLPKKLHLPAALAGSTQLDFHYCLGTVPGLALK